MSVESKKMFAILKAENPKIEHSLQLGGDLTLFETEKMAETWKDSYTSFVKRKLYKIYPVRIEFGVEDFFETQTENEKVSEQ